MLGELQVKIDQTLLVLKDDLASVRAGRASVGLVENVIVDVYGSKMPIKQTASITVPDSRSLAIQPWDKANLAPIEKAIQSSDLGLNPINDGTMIRINIPSLSAERREELVKLVAAKTEQAKISLRNIRHDILGVIERQLKEKTLGEDEAARQEKEVQAKIDSATKQAEELASVKEEEIRTV